MCMVREKYSKCIVQCTLKQYFDNIIIRTDKKLSLYNLTNSQRFTF